MSFESLTVKKLKALISVYKKEHSIVNYSKLKKKDLLSVLNLKFSLLDNKLILKPKDIPVVKQKKRITPQLVSEPAVLQPTLQKSVPNLTKGQQTLKNKIDKIEKAATRKTDLQRTRNFAKRIRGNI